jgi:hypothetical protein
MRTRGRRHGATRQQARLRSRAVLLLASLLSLAALVAAAPASAVEPGLNLLSLNAAGVQDTKTLGTPWVRMFITWPDIEPSRGVFAQNWFQYYEQEFQALPAGTKVILDVVDSPRWETGSSNEKTPPMSAQEYGQFVGLLAQRFGPRVAAYEIWNEEDEARWWSTGPDPTQYVHLLQAAYPAVKAAEPNATVVLGGLTGNDYPYLQGVYAAGGKGYFDAVGVHTDTACNILSPYEFLRGPDNRLIPDSFLAYREVHATMLANGDDKAIWMTELSWRTTSAVCEEGAWAGKKAQGVSDEQQASYLREAYHCLAQDAYVQVALWFPVQDEGVITAGLLRANGSRKPSFDAMREYVRSGDQLHEPCGVFSGPTITVASPADHIKYNGPLPISVRASTAQGVFRIKLLIDGHLIRNFDGPGYPTTLSGGLDWMGAKHISLGRHTLTFVAYDRQRNISQVSLTIFHGGSAGHASKKHKKHKKHKRRHSHH